MWMIFWKNIDNKKTDAKFCNTCNKRITRTGNYKQIKSNNQLVKAGEILKLEICKKQYISKRIIKFVKLNANNAVDSKELSGKNIL